MKDLQNIVELFEKTVNNKFPGDPLELVNDGTAQEIIAIANDANSIEEIDFNEYITELLHRIGYDEEE